MRARWFSVSPNAAAAEASDFAAVRPQAVAPTTTVRSNRRRSTVMADSGRLEGSADGALQVGAGVVGGAQRVGVLAFGRKQGAARIEHVERRRAAEAVARERDL